HGVSRDARLDTKRPRLAAGRRVPELTLVREGHGFLPPAVLVERVVDRPLRGDQLVIVGEAQRAEPLGDRPTAGGLRPVPEGIVGVGHVDDLREERERPIALQLVALHDRLEGALLPVMSQLDVRYVERNRALALRDLTDALLRNEEELGFGVDE